MPKAVQMLRSHSFVPAGGKSHVFNIMLASTGIPVKLEN
jgi:hypothetical protein